MPRKTREHFAPDPGLRRAGGDNDTRKAAPRTSEKPFHSHLTIAWRKRTMRQREIYPQPGAYSQATCHGEEKIKLSEQRSQHLAWRPLLLVRYFLHPFF